LRTRYATKHFSGEMIPDETIEEILEEMNLSPSALGLQPYQFIVVKDPELKEKLAEYSFHGIEVAKASHLIILAGMEKVSDEYIDRFIARTEKLRGLPEGGLKELRELTYRIVHSIDDHATWAEKQAYLVMGVLVLSAAEKGVDMTPMEVFDRDAYDEILKLSERGLRPVLVGVLGYRDPEDPDQYLAKTRRPLSEMMEWIPPRIEDIALKGVDE